MSEISSRATLTLIAAVSLMAVLPARAAHELDPGLWQLTETGLADGKPAKPEVSSDCLSPEEARDPVKTILKDTEGQKCETLKVTENGNTAMVEMKCGDPRRTWMGIDMTINFESARHYSGTIKSLVIFGGQRVASEKTIDAQWIAAACKK